MRPLKIGDRVRLRKDYNFNGYCCGYKESQAAGTIYKVTEESMSVGGAGTYFDIRVGNKIFCRTHSSLEGWEIVKPKMIIVRRKKNEQDD